MPVLRRTLGRALRWFVRTAEVVWPPRGWWVVNYHDISDDAAAPRITVPVRRFEEQVAALQRRFKVITLAEGLDRFHANAIDGQFVSLTFDDGYAGVAENAVPLLERYKIPATVFVCGTALVEGKETWDIALERLLRAGKAADAARVLGLAEPALLNRNAFSEIRRAWTRERGQELVLCARHVTDPPPARYLTVEQATRFDPALLTVGNHTWTHAIVSTLSAEEIQQEVGGNDEVLRRLPSFVPAFAYPFGTCWDMNPEATRIARDLFRLHVLSAQGGSNRNGATTDGVATRTAVTRETELPWDLTVAALLDKQ